jgi:hypothetical protein
MGGKAILIVVIGFGLILGYFSMNMNSMATRAVDNMSTYAGATESHNLATTGANVGLAKFYQDTTWFGSTTQSFSGGKFRGSFTVTNQNLGGGNIRLQSVSTYPVSAGETLHDTVEVYFDSEKRNSFSVFAYMTLIEGNIWWITGDTIWGKMHSNDIIRINGKPVFWGKVTTTRRFSPRPGRSTNRAIFKDGYETGVARIEFPDDLSELIAAASSGGRFYTGNIWVELLPGTAGNDDGMVYVRNTQTGPIIDSIALNDPGFNGVILGDSRVNVNGTLDGRLSLASLTDVYIQNDVVYQNRDLNITDDMLGLIADHDIVVADNAANNSNCVIDGSIFTRTGSFRAENYSTRPVGGELHIRGSLVQNRRGPVGTFSGSPPVIQHGFSKRYRYDDRLSDPSVRPPFYPGFFTRTYAIKDWWESVRLPKFN